MFSYVPTSGPPFCPQVTVQQNAISSDVVVMSLNQPANAVEKLVPELER